MLAVTGGALSIARNSAVRELSGRRLFWLGDRDLCLAGLPILVGLLLFGSDGFAQASRQIDRDFGFGEPEMNAMGGMDMAVMEDGEEMAPRAVPMLAMVKTQTMDFAPGGPGEDPQAS